MQEIITDALKLMEDDQNFVLATIIRQEGSAPRETGTRMIISEVGKGYGTVGGGQLEAAVMNAAPDVLKSGKDRILKFRLTGATVEQTDMLCGGNVDVYLESVTADAKNFKQVMTAAYEVIENGERGILVESIAAGPLDGEGSSKQKLGSYFLTEEKVFTGICESKALVSFCEDKMPEIISKNQPMWIEEGQHPQAGCNLFITPCTALHRVILFGGGHICLHLAKLVKMVGFSLVVADDRSEFVNPQRFPDADELWHTPLETVLKDRKIMVNDYLVIVTRGHQHDAAVLYQALQTSAGYTGMIGSRRKREIVYKSLLDRGVTQAELDSVYSPIGIKIASQTPEEIAVAIVAELIDVRGRALKRVKDWEV